MGYEQVIHRVYLLKVENFYWKICIDYIRQILISLLEVNLKLTSSTNIYFNTKKQACRYLQACFCVIKISVVRLRGGHCFRWGAAGAPLVDDQHSHRVWARVLSLLN